jgi:hypothetical protein
MSNLKVKVKEIEHKEGGLDSVQINEHLTLFKYPNLKVGLQPQDTLKVIIQLISVLPLPANSLEIQG